MKRFAYSFFLAWVSLAPIVAQQIHVSGSVTDARSGEPVLFANVFLADAPANGTVTDPQGYYSFLIDLRMGKYLEASAMGYKPQVLPIPTGDSLRIDFRLEPEALDIEEVVVYAGENPAYPILRRVIAEKERNNYNRLPAFSAERYSKLEMDLVGLSEKFMDNPVLKPFAFVFEHVDSSSEAKPFLPAYLQEELKQIYLIEGRYEEVPLARRVSNIGNESIIRFISLVHDRYDIYDNWLPVMDKAFAGPLADQAFANYEYYLLDSASLNGRWSYKLKFKPRRKRENTFTGEFWVDSTTAAVTRVHIAKSEDVNINLIGRVEIQMDFQLTADSVWMLRKEHTLLEYQLLEGDKTPGIIARKTNIYRDGSRQSPPPRTQQPDSRGFDPTTLDRDDSFWQDSRPEPLAKREASVYAMIDSIGNSEAFKRYKMLAYVLGSGYLPWGNIELGPLFSTYSNNSVEGSRFRFGLGTSYAFSKKWWIYGYAAYGQQDQRWKYGGHIQWQPNKHPWTTFKVSYKDDLELSFASSGEVSEDNFFAGAYRRNIPQKLMYTRQAQAFWEQDMPKGWNVRTSVQWQQLEPYARNGIGFNFYFKDPKTDQYALLLESAEMQVRLRWAPALIFVESHFSRASMGSQDPRPSIEPSYTLGKFGKDTYYHHVGLRVSQWFTLPPMGWLRYQVNAGIISNTLPYLLLHSPTANETYFYAPNAFNTLARYEFVSDTYIDALLVHHLDGFFFNRIPLFHKLKWREVLTFRAAYGTLRENNRVANARNHYDRTYTEYEEAPRAGEGVYYGNFDKGPLLEVGAGIENIFKVIRIDATWRLNYLKSRYASPLSLRGALTFYF